MGRRVMARYVPPAVRAVVARHLGVDSDEIASVEWVGDGYTVTLADGSKTMVALARRADQHGGSG